MIDLNIIYNTAALFLFGASIVIPLNRMLIRRKVKRYITYPGIVTVSKSGKVVMANEMAKEFFESERKYSSSKNLKQFYHWLAQRFEWSKENSRYEVLCGPSRYTLKMVQGPTKDIQINYYIPVEDVKSFNLPRPTKRLKGFYLDKLMAKIVDTHFASTMESNFSLESVPDYWCNDKNHNIQEFYENYFTLLTTSINPLLRLYEAKIRSVVDGTQLNITVEFAYRAKNIDSEILDEQFCDGLFRLVNKSGLTANPSIQTYYRDGSNFVLDVIVLEVDLGKNLVKGPASYGQMLGL